jgi:Tol biopolymer transport system component
MRDRGARLAVAGSVAVAVMLAGACSGADDGSRAAPVAKARCRAVAPVVALDRDTPGVIGAVQVVVANRAGATSLVTGDWVATNPSISPDGRRLAVVRAKGDYESAGPDSTSLWVINSDGSGAHALTDGTLDDDPAWSPDGRAVAFARRLPNAQQIAGSGVVAFQLMTVPVEGGEPRPLTDNHGERDYAPAWSPDMRQVAFAREERRPDGNTATAVWTVRADGTGARAVVADLPRVSSIQWHPDGDSLLVSADGAVLVVDPATGETPFASTEGSIAAWAPDGEGIYYAAGDRLMHGRIEDGQLVSDRDLGAVGDPVFGLDVSPCG